MPKVPFNRSKASGRESGYLNEVLDNGRFSSNGPFSLRCEASLRSLARTQRALITNSATAAIELATILADLGPGAEVIMPAFAYVTCANAIVLRRATPVFADILPDTLNLDVNAAASAITSRTRAILVIHYAGVPCDMDAFMDLAERHGLLVIEDAAQAFMSVYRGRPAGSIGNFGVFSFHDTKNVTCGEGGALLVNDPRFATRAEIVHQKGTDRAAFDRGETQAYAWLDLGSSFAPNEFTAAVLLAQLEQADAITRRRRKLWDKYHSAFIELEQAGIARRPYVPGDVEHNGHIYYLLLENEPARKHFITRMADCGISTPFHFVPLDDTPAGREFGRAPGDLPVTHSAATRLVRLPLWLNLEEHQDRVIDAVLTSVKGLRRT